MQRKLTAVNTCLLLEPNCLCIFFSLAPSKKIFHPMEVTDDELSRKLFISINIRGVLVVVMRDFIGGGSNVSLH